MRVTTSLAVLMLAASAAGAASTVDDKAWTEPATGIVFPPRLGTLTKSGVNDYETPEAGISVRYDGPDLVKADVFIYTAGISAIPNGMDNAVVSNHLEKTAREIRVIAKHGYFADFKERDRTTRALDATNATWKAFCQCFEYRETEKGGPVASPERRKSYLLVTGCQNRFLKVRFTFLAAKEAEGDQALDAFLRDLNKLLDARKTPSGT